MAEIKVGFVPLALKLFDMDWAQETRARSIEQLRSLEGVQIVAEDDFVFSRGDAQRAAERLVDQKVDLLLIQCTTFPGSGSAGHILAERVGAPVILWALPEPKLEGGALRSNSLCGITMIASTLNKLGIKFSLVLGAPEEAECLATLQEEIKVIGALRELKKLRLGLVGYRTPGFHDLAFDELELKKVIGPEVQQIDLAEVFRQAEAISSQDVEKAISHIRSSVGKVSDKAEQALERLARHYLALHNLAQEEHLGALAVKCWPEFQDMLKMNICLAHSLLGNQGLPCSCEADIDGAVSMAIGRYLTGQPVFFADLVEIDEAANTALLFHCGSAPTSLALDQSASVLEESSLHKVPGVVEFPLKAGRITFFKLSLLPQGYAILIASGEALPTEMVVRGNPLLVRFNQEVFHLVKTIIEEGIEHHYTMAYGDIKEALLKLCHWLDIRPILV